MRVLGQRTLEVNGLVLIVEVWIIRGCHPGFLTGASLVWTVSSCISYALWEAPASSSSKASVGGQPIQGSGSEHFISNSAGSTERALIKVHHDVGVKHPSVINSVLAFSFEAETGDNLLLQHSYGEWSPGQHLVAKQFPSSDFPNQNSQCKNSDNLSIFQDHCCC